MDGGGTIPAHRVYQGREHSSGARSALGGSTMGGCMREDGEDEDYYAVQEEVVRDQA
jgi:hypothetical protein